MSKLKNLYLSLCMSSLFREVLDKPLFLDLEKILSDEATAGEKIKAYSSFVNKIYTNGASLTDYVCRLVFEDENVYVKARAHGKPIAQQVLSAKERELSVFEEIAALTPQDFACELGVEYASPFESHRVDLCALYEER